MGKPTICIGENKGADQLREADHRVPTGTGKPGKHGKWQKKIPCMENSWNLKNDEYHGKIMEFCYETPIWMSLGFIFFLDRFARSISIDK